MSFGAFHDLTGGLKLGFALDRYKGANRHFGETVFAVDVLKLVSPELVNLSNDQLLVDLAAKSRIPTIYAYRETVARGGLMAYAPDWADTLRQAANAVGQILKGANPGDIPFYQATKFELVINVKTARALGLEIPSSLLLRADEVIE